MSNSSTITNEREREYKMRMSAPHVVYSLANNVSVQNKMLQQEK